MIPRGGLLTVFLAAGFAAGFFAGGAAVAPVVFARHPGAAAPARLQVRARAVAARRTLHQTIAQNGDAGAAHVVHRGLHVLDLLVPPRQPEHDLVVESWRDIFDRHQSQFCC